MMEPKPYLIHVDNLCSKMIDVRNSNRAFVMSRFSRLVKERKEVSVRQCLLGQMSTKGCNWTRLNAPGIENPLSHPLLELDEFPFPTISPLG